MRTLALSLLAGAFALGSVSVAWACPAHETHTASNPTVVAMDQKAPQSTRVQFPTPQQGSGV